MLRKLLVWLCLPVFCALLLIRPDRPLSQPAATFVGSETCRQCHEDQFTSFQATSHGRAAPDSAVIGTALGCETCHGPGSLHVAASGDSSDAGFHTMRNFERMPADQASTTCLNCHRAAEQFYWGHSAHARQRMGCTDCHAVHHPQDPAGQRLLKRASTTALCLTCHNNKRQGLTASGHMPLREGAMDCSSCHNPHGSPADRMLRAASTNELCESCHADKRGPFLWEHAPVRENCDNCHDPHGTSDERMLVRRPPYLCQTCHAGSGHPSSLYDRTDLLAKSNRLINRSCTNCHSQVHGSNHPSGQTFLR